MIPQNLCIINSETQSVKFFFLNSKSKKTPLICSPSRKKKKLGHYEELKRSYIVMPVAVETMGSWGQMGLKFVKDLGSRIADVTGETRSTSFLFQSLSMAIQRGNAISISGTAPNTKSLHELYYL